MNITAGKNNLSNTPLSRLISLLNLNIFYQFNTININEKADDMNIYLARWSGSVIVKILCIIIHSN